MNAAKVVEELKQRFPNEPEYIQAVSQVLPTIEEEYNKHPEFEKANLIETTSTPSLRRQTSSSVFASPIVFVSSVSLG